MTQIPDNFRHSWEKEAELLNLQRTDREDPLIVRDTFTLQKHECAQLIETLLKENEYFQMLALRLLEAQNIARPKHKL